LFFVNLIIFLHLIYALEEEDFAMEAAAIAKQYNHGMKEYLSTLNR
jgi:hypothetical protein